MITASGLTRVSLLGSMKLAFLFGLPAVLTACGAAAPAGSATPVAPASVVPVQGPEAATPAVVSQLKVGQSFKEVANVLAADGWLPLLDRAGCLERLGNRADLCRNAPGLTVCDAGKGSCEVRFAQLSNPQALTLRVSAPVAAAEPPSFGTVHSWTFAALPAIATAPGVACPASEFEGFLKAFAGDAGIRQRYTAPLVQVTQSFDEEEAGYVQRKLLVAAKDYTDFSLTYRDGGFHVVDSAGGISPAQVAPQIVPESDGGYYVKIPDDVEGVSYRFERHADCWRLAADPDPGAS